ncbi:hypothetical protein SAMN06265182_0508 [Persephonella hydrogeniphila]|uniref:Uncharacterized protein n=1 Tax=Persephonella hydrogeniphila TaxID=198703 RepID=A0A285N396_9AQUI|nr:hypothetical protein [Persephonella hydrogeniphila]SNZ03925.1 hypothetical protein SAMN06265182_0508 [Persephonella hydrogeniphila]
MKYKVSKEELDALFREVYSSSNTERGNYTTQPLKIKEEYTFIAYKFKHIVKSYLVSSLPAKIRLKTYKALEGNEASVENYYITGYDVENRYRVYISVSDNLEDIVKGDFHSLLNEKFNTQRFVENLSENFVSELKKDIPFSFKKINIGTIQFYEDSFVKLEYIFDIGDNQVEISVWIEKELVETGEFSPVIYTPPTSVGKKRIKRLKEILPVEVSIDTEPIMIKREQLKVGNELKVDIKIKQF